MAIPVRERAIGAPLDRLEGPQKVTGAASYAVEHVVPNVAYGFVVQSTVARGRIAAIDAAAAHALPGVLAIVTHENAPRLGETPAMLRVLQSDRIAFHGAVVALVVAETAEIARDAASRVVVRYDSEPADVLLRADHPGLYAPEHIVAGSATDTAHGAFDDAFGAAEIRVDATYATPTEHNNLMEPHAAIASWEGGSLTVYDTTQGPHAVRDQLAAAFGVAPERVRVIAPYVGGGFGSKGGPRSHVVLAAIGAQAVERPVKLAFTRRQMFALTGYRTPTLQRMRLGARRDGTLVAIGHDVVEQASTIEEFAEPTATCSRVMYAAPNRRTSHRLVRLDLPIPSYMRAPGEAPGMFALESAIDELAVACGVDPVALRIRNEPERDPERGVPFSSRSQIACLREGAARFGWSERDPRSRTRRDGRWWVGTGVAGATYPARRMPSSARASVDAGGSYRVEIGAADIGTGTLTALTQIAADLLDAPLERVTVAIGDSAYPWAFTGVGSMGLSSWSAAVEAACRALRARVAEHGGRIPADGLHAEARTGPNPLSGERSMHAFGAQFAEVRVDADTGEVRVPRIVGVFGVGRVVNAKTARSQLVGGMTWGISMALHEQTVVDPHFGHFATHDLAEYHIATNADVGTLEAAWVDEDDREVHPLGIKGLGEIGIVGTAAAIANAVHHATGVRVRDLPITPEKLAGQLP